MFSILLNLMPMGFETDCFRLTRRFACRVEGLPFGVAHHWLRDLEANWLLDDVFRQLPGKMVIGERRRMAVSLVEKTVGTRIEELAVIQNLDAA